MAMSKDTEKYHAMAPKDTCKDGETPLFRVNVVRTTSHTGEQFHIDCPVYSTDTREELDNRVGMCLSVIQDRLEAENEAYLAVQEASTKKRLTEEALRRNQKKLEKDLKKLEQQRKTERWTDETYEAKKADLRTRFETAQKTLEESETVEDVVANAPKNLEIAESAEATTH